MSGVGEIEPEFVSRQVSRARRFYFGREPGGGEAGLTVISGGWELVSGDYRIDRATFPWVTVEFVAGGRGKLWMGGESHALERGGLFAYGPGIEHRIETDREQVFSKFYLNLAGNDAADRMVAADLGPGTFRRMDNPDELERVFEGLVTEGAARSPQAAEIAGLLARILLLKITSRDGRERRSGWRARETARKCADYMDRHFLRVGTVEEVAEACHVSVGHLTRSFVRFGYGVPYRYLMRRKMVFAAGLLDSGRLLAREAAERLGMDPFQFSRVFKRVHGLSPSEFAGRHGGGVSRAGSGRGAKGAGIEQDGHGDDKVEAGADRP